MGKNKDSLINFSIATCLFFLTACGGGGGSSAQDDPTPIDPPPEPKPDFSLTLRQKTSCNPNALLPNASVMVYDGSQALDIDTPFTSYTTDANGLVEIDSWEHDKISFSIGAEIANGNPKIYTFKDLDVGDYDLTVLFEQESSLAEACTCQDVAFDVVPDNPTMLDGIGFSNIHWGNRIENYAREVSDKLSFSQVELCGTRYQTAPLFFSVSNSSNEEYYGFKDTSGSQDLSTPVDLRYSAVENALPDLGVSYSVSTNLVVGDDRYFGLSPQDTSATYRTYPDFGLAKSELFIRTNIETTYNGSSNNNETFVSAEKIVRGITPNAKVEELPSFPTGTHLDLSYDESSRVISYSTDSSFNSNDITYARFIIHPDSGGMILWYVYSPYESQIKLPRLDDSYEALLENSSVRSLFTSLIDERRSSTFTDGIKIRRFNDSTTGISTNEFDETMVQMIYNNMGVSSQSSTDVKLESGVVEFLEN